MLKCAAVRETNMEKKQKEIINSILAKGGNDPDLVMKVITTCLWLRNEEVDQYHEPKHRGGHGRVQKHADPTTQIPECRGKESRRSYGPRVCAGHNG